MDNKPYLKAILVVSLVLLVIASVNLCHDINNRPNGNVVGVAIDDIDFHHKIGPTNPVVWESNRTLFFSGKLNVVADREFTIMTRDDQLVVSSVPGDPIPGNETPYFVASFQATAKSYYRTTSVVAIYSDIDTEVFLFFDPLNNVPLP